MFRFSVAALAILLIMIPVHADVNAKPSGHRRTSHVAGKTGGDGKHLSAGKADAKVSATVMTTIDAVGPKAGKGGWTRVLRIGAWGVIVVAGMMLVAQRLKDRFLALEHGRVRIGERVDALKRAIATGRQRAECQTAFKTDPRSASNIDPSSLCSRTGGEARSGQLAQRVAA